MENGKKWKEWQILFSFFFFFLNLFNWRLITLYIIVVFDIHWHESAMGVHVLPILNSLPPSSPSHPSGLSQCTSPERPVSCIVPGLANHFTYGNIHVSMPFSQIVPPLPSPQSPKACSLHLCLFCCLSYRVISAIFLNSIYIYALVYCISVFLSGLLHSV